MSELEPALSPGEWEFLLTHGVVGHRWRAGSETARRIIDEQLSALNAGDLYAIIAAANATLPDNDPHKIDHGDVIRLRDVRNLLSNEGCDPLDDLAVKLAALLPPLKPAA